MGPYEELKIHVSSDVISQEVHFNETILMNVSTLAYFGLDALGTRMWALITGGEEPAKIVEQLEEEFGLPTEDVQRKFQAVLSALERTGLVSLGP